jgi:hypothetical protein
MEEGSLALMRKFGTAVALLLMSASVQAANITLLGNSVIIDNSPFNSMGLEDEIGTGNFALNHPTFIDVPFAIFDFGGATSVSSATLTWNFLELFGNSGPASISLYAGTDTDGIITPGDRFMGTAIDTFVYSVGVSRTFDVTAWVNAALAGGQYFAVRLEANVAPGDLTGFYGGQFEAPSLDASSVPEPSTIYGLMLGLGAIALAKRKSRKA